MDSKQVIYYGKYSILPIQGRRVTLLALSGRGGIHRVSVDDIVDLLLELVDLFLNVRVLVRFLAVLRLVLLKNVAESPEKSISKPIQ
jgi:hypothetical protein